MWEVSGKDEVIFPSKRDASILGVTPVCTNAPETTLVRRPEIEAGSHFVCPYPGSTKRIMVL